MKNLTLLIAVAIVSLFSACKESMNLNRETSLENLSQVQHPEVNYSTGHTEIYTNSKEVLINHFSNSADEEGRTFYLPVVSNQNNLSDRKISVSNSEILFTDYSVIVHDLDSKKHYSFSLEVPHGSIVKTLETIAIKSKSIVNETSATGLSQFTKVWKIDEKLVFKNSFREYYNPENSRNPSICESGQCGSSECSSGGFIAQVFGDNCQVTCDPGFYACCTADAKCFCNPDSECGNSSGGSGGPGGGSGGSSNCNLEVIYIEDEGGELIVVIVALIC